MNRTRPVTGLPDRIRRLELKTGMREWDAQDDKEAEMRLHAMIRYVDREAVARFIVEEKQRLGIA